MPALLERGLSCVVYKPAVKHFNDGDLIYLRWPFGFAWSLYIEVVLQLSAQTKLTQNINLFPFGCPIEKKILPAGPEPSVLLKSQ